MRELSAVAAALSCGLAVAVGGCSGPAEERARIPDTTKLELVVVADLQGVLEPCGCGGHPAGGVDRVVAAITELRSRSSTPVVLALGALFTSLETQHERVTAPDAARWKADAMVEALQRMQPSALALAADDLEQGGAQLDRLRAALPGRVIADTPLRPASELLPGPIPVGLATASLPGGSVDAAGPASVLDRRVAELATVVRGLRQRGARVVVASIHGGAAASNAALLALGAEIVVQTGLDTALPTATWLGDGTLLVRPARQGEALTHVELVVPTASLGARRMVSLDDGRERPADAIGVRVEHRVLDSSAARDPGMRELLSRLFARIDAHHAREAALAAAPATDDHTLSYVGSETCAACHTATYYWWRASPHGRALDALVARGRQRDFECVGCHSTGFDAETSSLRDLEHRAGVGCESCHGPGSAHVDNPRPPHRGITRAVPESRCVTCHDLPHSRPFDYAERRLALLTPAHGGR